MEFWVQIILSIALLQMCTLTKNSLRMKETLCALLTLVVFAFNCTFNCTFCTCPWEHWLFYHGPRRSTRRPSILHRPACHCLSLLVIFHINSTWLIAILPVGDCRSTKHRCHSWKWWQDVHEREEVGGHAVSGHHPSWIWCNTLLRHM